MAEILALRAPACPEFDGAVSNGSLLIESGNPLTLWPGGATTNPETAGETLLQIQGNQQIVIGRQEGGEVPYLDPRFRPTRMVPQTGQPILKQHGYGTDNWVSRGHFMLRASTRGLILVNGVPRRGGGLRPPLNGTRMLQPHHRYMGPGEEFLIERGAMIRIELPNGTVVCIQST